MAARALATRAAAKADLAVLAVARGAVLALALGAVLALALGWLLKQTDDQSEGPLGSTERQTSWPWSQVLAPAREPLGLSLAGSPRSWARLSS